MCLREGIGDIFADGVLRGREGVPGLKGVAVHVKGMEPAGYDPRVLKGMGLGFATPRAAPATCAPRSTSPSSPGSSTRRTIEGKAAIYCDWEDRLTIMDTLIYCRFYRDLVQWPFITAVVNAAIGTDYTQDDMRRIANRIVTDVARLQRARGIGRERSSCPTGSPTSRWRTRGRSRSRRPRWTYMLADYYRMRGWGSCRR